MRFSVYQDCDCIEEYETAEEAIAAAKALAEKFPDSVIDALDDEEQTSLWGIN